jgi:hypothetical protein
MDDVVVPSEYSSVLCLSGGFSSLVAGLVKAPRDERDVRMCYWHQC